MLNKECQNCISMLQDYLDGTLDPVMQEHLHAHLESCDECRDLLREYRQIEYLLRTEPAVSVPASSMPDTSKIIAAAERRAGAKRRQWVGTAAALLVFASSALLMNESFAPPETAKDGDLSSVESIVSPEEEALEYGVSSMADQAAGSAAEDMPEELAVESQEKLCLRYQPADSETDPFIEAQRDPDFAALLAANDLGYGYELIDFTEEEDGSLTFVIYFYEDAQRTVDTGVTDDQWPSCSNVRSLNWKESE